LVGEPVKPIFERLVKDLGSLGIFSLVLIALTAAFCIAVIKPLEERNAQLAEAIAAVGGNGARKGFERVSLQGPAAQLREFYAFFNRPQRTDEWLAKLYGIATASGLPLRSAEYRLSESRWGIELYRLTLPVSGTYSQIRAFTLAALGEIPVLSLDQINFKRKGPNEARVEAEIVMTLHLHEQ
jgi:hypothetical protein